SMLPDRRQPDSTLPRSQYGVPPGQVRSPYWAPPLNFDRSGNDQGAGWPTNAPPATGLIPPGNRPTLPYRGPAPAAPLPPADPRRSGTWEDGFPNTDQAAMLALQSNDQAQRYALQNAAQAAPGSPQAIINQAWSALTAGAQPMSVRRQLLRLGIDPSLVGL